MKFFHLADLHLGKRVNGFPMLEDQKDILEKIIAMIDREHPDAVIIAGDVYDKSIPPVEAVNLFDDFLAALSSRKLQVFIISGNHDSAERISYGGRVMEQSGIHISRRITGVPRSAAQSDDGDGSAAGFDPSEEASVDFDTEYGSAAGFDPSEEADADFDTEYGSAADFDTAGAAPGGESGSYEKENREAAGSTNRNVIVPICLTDEYGPVYIYLFPYVHPSVVREAFPDEKINSWTDALEVLVRHAQVDPDARNIAAAHQFITADGVRPEECDSEQKHVGGLDNVEFSVFRDFDYVALGHLHGPQRIGRDTVRYAGSPLKYSFSEEKQKKSVTVVEVREKGCVEITQLPLPAKRDFKTVRGTFDELMSPQYTANLSEEDYYRVILTDELDVDQAMSRLRARFYKNMMELDYDNPRTRGEKEIEAEEGIPEREPIEVLKDLYEKQNGIAMSEFQTELAERLIEKIWGSF